VALFPLPPSRAGPSRAGFLLEETMSAFKSRRVTHEYTQTNNAPPEKVFPLLCPVREADWAPGWQYRLIYSDSGVAELGCIFTTPNPPSEPHASAEKTWIVTDYDPAAFRIGFVWINPNRVATEIRIQLMPAHEAKTQASIRYRYTSLSEEGNREITTYDENWFRNMMQGWETAINEYLRSGKRAV
jgi:hypothetical protein